MKVLVVGSGGREHTIIWKLRQSSKVDKIYCAPGNGGISDIAECVDIKVNEFQKIADFCKENSIDMAIIGPDDPLAEGIVDVLEAQKIRTFGPNKVAAQLEASKAFSKDFMKRHNIPTADYIVIEDKDEALNYLKRAKYPVVIKADGLALGKGVSISQTYEEAAEFVKEIMEDKIFGEAGSRVIIEEFLVGKEVSVLSFVDGKTIKPMVSAQDHKRIFEGNEGPNTGGMGTVCPPKHYTKELQEIARETIIERTLSGLIADGIEFKGIIFFGFIITEDGPKVLEYNARFGDPETQSVLLRLENDLYDVFDACIDGRLDQIELAWTSGASCCVIAASGGYPGNYKKGLEITGIQEAEKDSDIVVFHAGTKKENGKYYTNGGRVLGVSAIGSNMDDALNKAYGALKKINFEGMFIRKDIGKYSN